MTRLRILQSLVCLGIAALLVVSFTAGVHSTPAKPAGLSQSDLGWWACNIAQTEVAGALKAPSSARFPNCLDTPAANVGAGLWKLTSYVDAQNSFGAKLRQPFTIVLTQPIAGSNSWSVVSLDLP